MKQKISFKTRIVLIFSMIIALFTTGVILFEQQQLKKERTMSLERTLESNADIVYNYLQQNGIDITQSPERAGELFRYMSPNLRMTVISWEGEVLFDNLLDAKLMDNHLKRPEVQKAIGFGYGSNTRLSESNNSEYLYYAKKYNVGFFIRMAVPYDIEVQSFLNEGGSFFVYILLFFVVCVLIMLYFSNRFSRSLRELREFSLNLKNGTQIYTSFDFTDDEVGKVSSDIVENYSLLQKNRRELAAEREKLLQHFQFSEEGIAIFSKEYKEVYANSHFLQFLNMISNKPTLEAEQLFGEPLFADFLSFLNSQEREGNMYAKRIEKSGRQFNVRVIIFEDESFEFYISDITKSEKTRLLKQEMTNNIAHELRTPVTSIRGYLETILSLYEQESIDQVRIQGFVDRAYLQTIRLSELIQDISMLTKIEEASDRFDIERVPMRELLNELHSDLDDKLQMNGHTLTVSVNNEVVLSGSRTLLYSIFRNLVENSISYGGEHIDIVVRCYIENEQTYFFEYYDTGAGVEEKHLVRIFERFYRVNEGRTRTTGGSGLGLSIVRNAVLFHKGSIVANNRPEGGLRFLMTFPKK